MFGISRIVALILAFTTGFGLAAGIFIGAPIAILSTHTIRDLEESNLISIPDEKFISPDAPVDILDLNVIDLYNEYMELQSFGDTLNLNDIKERYGFIFHPKLDLLLSEKARTMPLKQLLSMEGVHLILQSVYIGNIEKYECYDADGKPGADPEAEGSYWVNADKKRVSELEQIIANFTLDDFISGNINTDIILHGNLVLADILGYHFDNDKNYWVDAEGARVTGVMAVFADCTLDTVDDKINEAKIGELLGYTLNTDNNLWYEVDESGNLKSEPIHSFMNAVACESVSTLGGLFETITVGQIIPAKDRETGLLSIIPADTKIDQIGSKVNESVSSTPLQFFINQNLVDFKEIDAKLDSVSSLRSDYIYIDVVNEGEEGYDKFLQQMKYYDVVDANGNKPWEAITDENGVIIKYRVEIWRTKLLSESFAYMIKLITPSTTP